MFQKVLKISILSLVVSLFPSSFQSANAVDVLWNPGIGNDLSGSGAGLVPGAGIRNTGLLVYKSNPDELVMKIIMTDSFEDKPFSGKGRNMAMWIYWPKDYCWSKESANCDGLFTIGQPFNPSSYPSAKSSEYVFAQKHTKESNVDVKPTTCKAPWWVESTYKIRDTWSFAISITCLGIPKDFNFYAFSQIDIGQKDVATDFTSIQTITYPFHELAAIAAAKNAQTSTTASDGKQVCVSGTTGAGYDLKGDFLSEICSGSNSWEYIVCVAHPKSDLQVFRNKKWQKVKTVKGVKDGTCNDSIVSYSFTFNSSLLEKYRIKSYGDKKYLTSYIDLKISRKVPTST